MHIHTVRVISSVGRAPPLQGGGHWFEPGITHQSLPWRFRNKTFGVISSVGRAPPLQGGGHWFEPGITHHLQMGR
jgi:hypothetical protein